MGNITWGFEWGWRDEMLGSDKALISLRIGKMCVIHFEIYKNGGVEIRLLGFWCIYAAI